MGKRRTINPVEFKKNVDALLDFIYRNELERDFEQFSAYHFRLKKKIDVWPSSKKYYVRGTSSSHRYSNLSEIGKFL